MSLNTDQDINLLIRALEESEMSERKISNNKINDALTNV